MKRSRVAIILICLLLGSASWAGKKGGVDAGGGGLGVELDSHVYLLDLYDNGVHTAAFNDRCSPDQDFLRSLALRADLSRLPLKSFLCELEKLSSREPFLASVALEGIKTLRWNFTDDALTKTDDEGSRMTTAPAIQVAHRQGDLVLIQKALWSRMNILSQTALLYHEIFSAFGYGSMLPSEIRRSVALIFDPDFETRDLELIESTLHGLPTIDAVPYRYPMRRGQIPMTWNLLYANSAPVVDQRSASVTVTSLDHFIWFPQFVIRSQLSEKPDIFRPVTYLRVCDETLDPDYLHQRAALKYDIVRVTRTVAKVEDHLPALDWELQEKSVLLPLEDGDTAQRFDLCSMQSRKTMKDIESWAMNSLFISPSATHRYLDEQ